MFARNVCIPLVALAMSACIALPAAGSDWASPVAGCVIVTAYGAECVSGTHRGVDLDAPAGAEIGAPTAARVSFAGQVPADGGGTCGAVTLELGDGSRVSLLPLDEVFVSTADPVAAGEVVGTLAASGDDSACAPHLHLSLRQGDVYLDPTGLLPVGESPDAPEDAPVVPGTTADADASDGDSSSEGAESITVAEQPECETVSESGGAEALTGTAAAASASCDALGATRLPSVSRAAGGMQAATGAVRPSLVAEAHPTGVAAIEARQAADVLDEATGSHGASPHVIESAGAPIPSGLRRVYARRSTAARIIVPFAQPIGLSALTLAFVGFSLVVLRLAARTAANPVVTR